MVENKELCVHCTDLNKQYDINSPEKLQDIMMKLQGYLKSKVLEELDPHTLFKTESELFYYKKGEPFYGHGSLTHTLRCRFCGLIYVLGAAYDCGRCSFSESTQKALDTSKRYAEELENLKLLEKKREIERKKQKEKWIAIYKKVDDEEK